MKDRLLSTLGSCPRVANLLSFLTCSNNLILLYSCVYEEDWITWGRKPHGRPSTIAILGCANAYPGCSFCVCLQSENFQVSERLLLALNLTNSWLIDKILKCFKRTESCCSIWEQQRQGGACSFCGCDKSVSVNETLILKESRGKHICWIQRNTGISAMLKPECQNSRQQYLLAK